MECDDEFYEPQGQKMAQRGERVGLPTRGFLYTLDQVSEMIAVDMRKLRLNYIHFDGRTVGTRSLDRLVARNIAPPGAPPEWRVAENELIRWLRRKGFRLYDRNWVVA